jgi:signal transduction histidine kinase
LGILVFGSAHAANGSPFWQVYLLSPVLMWAALRFYQRGAVTAIFIVSVIAIGGTAAGLGPFIAGPLHVRLQELQMFLAVTTLTFLVLGVVSAERKAAESELLHAKEEAEAASLAKSRFLAVTSHELRTPLTGIVGYADLLETGVAGPMTEPQREKIGRIKAAAWHLVSIIEDILSFSRAEAGREKVAPEAVDAVVLARGVVALIEPSATAKGLVITLQTTHDRTPIYTDARKVSQILVNVLGNAVKFTEQGSVELSIARDDSWVVFKIRDEGPGIPHEQLGRIFEPFTQVDQSATRTQGGSGLGLSVARAFAELLRGSITVQSTVGVGSTFTVRLPANYAARPASRRA